MELNRWLLNRWAWVWFWLVAGGLARLALDPDPAGWRAGVVMLCTILAAWCHGRAGAFEEMEYVRRGR